MQRNAHIVTRFPVGTGLVIMGGGGLVLTIGGFSPAGATGVFELRMANFGWLIDLSAHFAYWKLHRASLVYTPGYHGVTNSTALNSAGTAVCGFCDDPNNSAGTTPATILELRGAGEFEFDRRWHVDYVPTGPQAGWLMSDVVSTTQTGSQMRLSSAGQLLMASTLPSTALFYGANMGRLELIVDVSFKGARPFTAVTLSRQPALERKALVEEKKESEAIPKGTSVSTLTSEPEEFELVEFLRSAPSLKEALKGIRTKHS